MANTINPDLLTPPVAAAESTGDKLVRLRKEKADREAIQADTRAATELAELELESKFSADGSRPGVDFAMVVDRDLGPDSIIVVKLGKDLAFRRFVDATVAAAGLATANEQFEFTAPAVVHPSPEQYARLVNERGGLATRACNALSSLHRIAASKSEGKF